MKCRMDGTQHTPSVRECSDDVPGGAHGNPVGCGFKFDAGSGTASVDVNGKDSGGGGGGGGGSGLIKSLSCKDEDDSCLAVNADGRSLSIVPCADPSAAGWSAHPATP
jgi:hypothetical protein